MKPAICLDETQTFLIFCSARNHFVQSNDNLAVEYAHKKSACAESDATRKTYLQFALEASVTTYWQGGYIPPCQGRHFRKRLGGEGCKLCCQRFFADGPIKSNLKVDTFSFHIIHIFHAFRTIYYIT